MSRFIKICLISLFLILCSTDSFAGCTGSGLTWTCDADSTAAEVNACIASATTGATITFAAGTHTWNATVTWANKNINLVGAGSGDGGTRINISTNAITADVNTPVSANTSTISGFKFYSSGASGDFDCITMRGQGWRVYNNSIENHTDGKSMVCVLGDGANSDSVQSVGLVDNNYMYECRVRVYGGSSGIYWAGSLLAWADASVIGTGNAVFFEDNTFYRETTGGEWNDASSGGKYVLRYNTFTGNHQLHSHSIQGAQMRGTRSWEIYGNQFTSSPNQAALIRAGTGMIFGNYFNGTSEYTIAFDNVRCGGEKYTCCGSNPPPATDDSGACDGTSLWDGNEGVGDAAGYPCRDQIGMGQDTGSDSSVIGKAIGKEPAYLWVNKKQSDGNVLATSISTYHIVANRDYYDYSASFDGTAGTGCGTLAARPATCTTGVGYWATDQSCSDLTGMVGATPATPLSGTLYKCTSTNTWTSYYTPYTYPHRLRGKGTATIGSGGTVTIGSGGTITF